MAQFEIDENGHCVIPAGTTEIEESAFIYCDDLKSIKIPESVTEIGEDAFNGCDNL